MSCHQLMQNLLKANLFFQLIARRYEKHSTIFTTNKNFGEWQDIFQDSTISAAILDRILHHSKVIKIVGESYRLKERGDLLAKNDSSSCTFFQREKFTKNKNQCKD